MHIFPFAAWGSAPPPPPPLSRGWPRTHTRRPSGAGLPSGPSQTDLSSRPPCACASHPPDTRPPARILLRLCCPLWAAPASLRAGGTPRGAFSMCAQHAISLPSFPVSLPPASVAPSLTWSWTPYWPSHRPLSPRCIQGSGQGSSVFGAFGPDARESITGPRWPAAGPLPTEPVVLSHKVTLVPVYL